MGKIGGCRQTAVLLDLDNYRHNVRLMRGLIGPCVKLMAVVKADAYGHGLLPFARAALSAGADCLGIAIAEEGSLLRRAGLNCPIHVFGALNEEGFQEAARARLIAPVFTVDGVCLAQRAAASAGTTLEVHLKLDTGMGRIGLRTAEELDKVLGVIAGNDRLRLTGAFTHFADADNSDQRHVDEQLNRFRALVSRVPQGLTLHAAASAAAIRRPDTRFDMVRGGIALYGYPPVDDAAGFLPCMSWQAEITHVKEIDAGDSVSYGCTYTASRPTTVATLAIGYGDGYPRALSSRAQALVHGRRCPVLGRVCMDQLMVDVSAVREQTKVGDVAVMLGSQGAERIDAQELADLCGTISYEILLAPKARMTRVYSEEREADHAEQTKG